MEHTNIIRIKCVIAKTGKGRASIYDALNTRSPRHDPTFPKPVKIGARAVGWLESEVNEWIRSRERVN